MDQQNNTPQTTDTPLTPPVLPDQKQRRRTGKIANLPAEIRDFVNEALDNGTTYLDVAAKLAVKGVPDINDDNIRNWANGGFQDYLREKRRNSLLREQTDKMLMLAATLDENGRAGYEKISSTLVAGKIIDAIQDFDSRRLRNKMNQNPDLFFRAAKVVNAQSMDYSRLRKVELEFQKYRDHVAEQKAKMEAAAKPRNNKGLTKEQTAEIIEAMRML
jgi:hypothetical protein